MTVRPLEIPCVNTINVTNQPDPFGLRRTADNVRRLCEVDGEGAVELLDVDAGLEGVGRSAAGCAAGPRRGGGTAVGVTALLGNRHSNLEVLVLRNHVDRVVLDVQSKLALLVHGHGDLRAHRLHPIEHGAQALRRGEYHVDLFV